MTGHKIKVDKKIIFYMGGFAGDLIASLYDPDVFIKFDEHTNYVKINHDAKQLKAIRNIKNWNFEEKVKYINDCQYNVFASHDLELAIRLKENTIFVYCSDPEMTLKFYNRVDRTVADDASMTYEDYLKHQDSTLKFLKNRIDLKHIFDDDFMEKYNITPNEKNKSILTKWKSLNPLD